MNLTFRFGQPETSVLSSGDGLTVSLRNAVVSGNGAEQWQLPDLQYEGVDAFHCHTWRNRDFLCMAVAAPVTQPSIREISRTLYANMLNRLGPLQFYRIWNFIPGINDRAGELDTYKLFCLGRGEAFDNATTNRLPAASAVGTPGNHLVIVALAGSTPVTDVENPLQIPAFRYPERYGPRSPSFARATRVGTDRLFISGTAAIRQSESLHDGDVAAQLRLAVDNINIVIRSAALDGTVQAATDVERSARLYLRNPDAWTLIAGDVHQLVRVGRNALNVIQAGICRDELLVEVEVSIGNLAVD